MSDIAQSQQLSVKYLEQLGTELKKAGFVSSSSGLNGGYRLAKPANEISVGGVMRLMENSFFKIHCVDDPEKNCVYHGTCVLCPYWYALENTLADTLDGITLDGIIKRQETAAPI
jgi:Rrf2 family protein